MNFKLVFITLHLQLSIWFVLSLGLSTLNSSFHMWGGTRYRDKSEETVAMINSDDEAVLVWRWEKILSTMSPTISDSSCAVTRWSGYMLWSHQHRLGSWHGIMFSQSRQTNVSPFVKFNHYWDEDTGYLSCRASLNTSIQWRRWNWRNLRLNLYLTPREIWGHTQPEIFMLSSAMSIPWSTSQHCTMIAFKTKTRHQLVLINKKTSLCNDTNNSHVSEAEVSHDIHEDELKDDPLNNLCSSSSATTSWFRKIR